MFHHWVCAYLSFHCWGGSWQRHLRSGFTDRLGSKSQSPAHFTRVNKKLIKLGFNLAKHPFERLPIPVVTVMTVVVMAARGWWPPLLLSVTGCGRSDGVAYQSFLSLTALRLGVQALVAAAVEDNIVAITITGAGVVVVVAHCRCHCRCSAAQLLGAVTVVNGEVR